MKAANVLEKQITRKYVKEEIKELSIENNFDEFDLVDNENFTGIEKNYCKKEKDLSKKETTIMKTYLEEISKYKLLTFEEEKALSKLIQEEEDQEALNKLINSNLRLVVKIAKHYISAEYPFIDIIQDGNMGLIKAAGKYDYKKNVKFSTYASWWIKQTIVRSLSVKKRMIRLSHRKEEKLRKINTEINKYYQKNRKMPDEEALSDILDISKKEIKEILSMSKKVVSIEESINDANFTVQKTISDESFIPDDVVENKVLRKETEKILEDLVPRERAIISFRFGFKGNEKYTLKRMGEMFGISAETVRQIELRALRKIKNKFPHLRDFIN